MPERKLFDPTELADEEVSRKLPGGPYRSRPLEINGVFYDPLKPPKLFRHDDGTEEYKGGRVLTKDEAHSMMFWAKGQPEGLREAMIGIIEKAVSGGYFTLFVGATKNKGGRFELDQKSKEKLSAYRELAKELGYEIGPFRYDENTGVAKAKIESVA